MLRLLGEKIFSLKTELLEETLTSGLGVKLGLLQPLCYQKGNQPDDEANTQRKKIWAIGPGDIV